MTTHEWQEKSRMASDRAERISKAIIKRAKATCKLAGLDPELLGIHPHNAMVSFEHGQPWPEVNYSLCRKVIWLINKSYNPSRIASEYSSRIWKDVVFP